MASSAWPPSNGTTTITVPRESTILPLYASTRINAPASKVFETLLNVSKYEEWNRWIPKVKIVKQPLGEDEEPPGFEKLQLDSIFTFYVIMNDKKPDSFTETGLKVVDISTPDHPSEYVPKDVLENDASFTADLQKVYRVGWKGEGGFVSKGLSAERFHEVIVTGDNECEVRTWENQGGILAHTVKWLYGKTLMNKFQMWVDDLKAHCEK